MNSRNRKSEIRFRFHIPLQVRFRDVDIMGHVNHAVYFSFFEMARTEYWMSLLRLRRLRDLGIIVVRAECSYKSAAQYAEWLDVSVGITEIRNSSFVMEYEARERRSGNVVATGSTVQVLFDYTRNRAKVVPPALRNKIQAFEKRPVRFERPSGN